VEGFNFAKVLNFGKVHNIKAKKEWGKCESWGGKGRFWFFRWFFEAVCNKNSTFALSE